MAYEHKDLSDFEVLEYIPLGVFVLRKDFVVLFWNSLLEEWTGIQRDEIIGTSIFGHFPNLNSPKYTDRLTTIFSGGPPIIFSSQLHKHLILSPLSNNRFRIQHTTVIALQATDEDFHALFTIQDVTDMTQRIHNYRKLHDSALLEIEERQKAEKALERLNEELENRVAQRTAELREKDQLLLLQSRQAALGEMVGNISHQWRQPLNALALTIQRLLLDFDPENDTREFLEKNVNSSMELIRHMSRTIDDFRNYFRPDKEKVEFKVSEAVADTLSLIEDGFKDQRIGIEVDTKGDPVICGFRNEFTQALLNILNNAGDALTERGVGDPRVTITICSEGCGALVTIADNAGGVPEEIMDKIFDPYFTTKGPQTGTGVGLFMAKAIIEKNMGGSLTARNIANGAEFRIKL